MEEGRGNQLCTKFEVLMKVWLHPTNGVRVGERKRTEEPIVY